MIIGRNITSRLICPNAEVVALVFITQLSSALLCSDVPEQQ